MPASHTKVLKFSSNHLPNFLIRSMALPPLNCS